MSPLEGECQGVVSNWPPSLLASLQRWGTMHPKSPCLTALDNAGKPVYTLTYGTTANLSVEHARVLCVCVCLKNNIDHFYVCLDGWTVLFAYIRV